MYAVIRLRSSVHTRPDIKDTLKMMRLNRINHCAVLAETPNNKGMIQKVKDYVAWGIIDVDSLDLILHKRGELEGGTPLTDKYVKDAAKYKSIKEFAKAVCDGDASLKDIPKLTPVFRLHPPRKGHRGIKKTFQQGGALGFYGEEINALIKQMR
ncbi:MAG: 50S ribosomal protein L30 [Methanosarcinales archaeon Met12]|nr:MAG: 50S ribosomal protein L30 [Methanosarcinales archaeon Met12]